MWRLKLNIFSLNFSQGSYSSTSVSGARGSGTSRNAAFAGPENATTHVGAFSSAIDSYVMTMWPAAGSLVFGEAAVSSVTASSGVREAGIELSLTRLADNVLQPPIAKPDSANTIRNGRTSNQERTPSPLLLDPVRGFPLARLRLFAQVQRLARRGQKYQRFSLVSGLPSQSPNANINGGVELTRLRGPRCSPQ